MPKNMPILTLQENRCPAVSKVSTSNTQIRENIKFSFSIFIFAVINEHNLQPPPMKTNL